MARHAPTPQSLRILVVDDEPRIRSTLEMCLEDEGHKVTTVGDADEAATAVARQVFDVAFLDLRLGVASGLDLIPSFLKENPHLKIIVITAYASVETAVEAMKRGAADYLPKPFTPAQVRLVAQKIAERHALETQVQTLRERLQGAAPDVRLESQSPVMQRMLDLSRQVVSGDTTVLLRGESGTGKSVLAEAIHMWSPRSDRPFTVVHCPPLPVELAESELFGHTKGAFTGAVEANSGRVVWAEGGTLFLDEIGDLPLRLQAKLEDREQELLAAASEDVVRLRNLVNDLLDLSKIEAGKIDLDFDEVPVALLFDKTLQSLQSQAEDSGVELSTRLPDPTPNVWADANKITWVLTNLVANALRYTDAGGHIELRAETAGSKVHLSVEDDGQRIPYAYQSKIFDKFVQVEGSSSVGGSGLGLAICKEVIRAHGGSIWVDSTPGLGSTFTFTLPVAASPS